MGSDQTATVRMFGLLHSARRAAGLPTTLEMDVPSEGVTARQIALELGLDLGLIEGVFVNRTVYGLDHPIVPGDRVAFVPHGTPGPHRLFLGLYDAGRSEPDDAAGSEPDDDLHPDA
jgi:molybdopterin converting factor small subunit